MNTFQNLNNGIIAENAGLQVVNTSFAHIKKQGANSSSYPLTGYGIHASADNFYRTLTQVGLGSTGSPSFDDCTTGIFGDRMAMRVSQNNMDGMYKGVISHNAPFLGSPYTVDIKNNHIDCKRGGIQVSMSNPKSKRQIFGNEVTLTEKGTAIQMNGFGLEVSNPGQGTIEQNKVFLNGFTSLIGIKLDSEMNVDLIENEVDLSGAGNVGTGILVDDCELGLVQCNNVQGGGQIGLHAASSPSTVWTCNQIGKTKTAIRFDGGCISSRNFRGNTMQNADFGLLMNSDAQIGTQTARGNRWLGFGDSPNAAIHYGDNGDIELSQFRANENSNDFWPGEGPSTPFADVDWFIPNSTSPYLCADGNTELCPIDELTEDNETNEVDIKITETQGQSTKLKHWLAERYLYKKLERYPALQVPNGEFEVFHSSLAQQTVGLFTEVDGLFGAAFSLSESTLTNLDNLADAKKDLNESIADLKEQITTAGNANQNQLAQLAQLELDLSDVEGQEANLLQNNQAAIVSGIQQAMNANGAIPAIEDYEKLEQEMNGIFCKFVLNGSVLSNDQIDRLKQIALLCPADFGRAVYKARSLFSLVEAGNYDDEVLCDEVGRRSAPEAGKEFAADAMRFSLFPNPASDYVQLSWNVENGFSENLRVELFDLTGQQLLRKEVALNDGQCRLETVTLSTGIYLVKIVRDGVVVFTEKLSLLKKD